MLRIEKKRKMFYLNNLVMLDLEQSKNFLSMEKYFVKHFATLFDKRSSQRKIFLPKFKKELKKMVKFDQQFVQLELSIPMEIFIQLSMILTTEIPSLTSYIANRNVFIVLKRLKSGESFRNLSHRLCISKTTIHKLFKPTLCILLSKLNNININNSKFHFNDNDKVIIGCIDNTTSYRNRIHPGSGTLYRTDKKGHFLTSMIIIDLFGSSILHVSIFRGHNNDKSCFKLSGLKDFLQDNKLYLLSDMGYSSVNIIDTRNKEFKERFVGGFQSSCRSIIENLFGNQSIGSWNIFTGKNKDQLEIHGLSIRLAYEIMNLMMQEKPMRENWLNNMNNENLMKEKKELELKELKKKLLKLFT